MSVLSVNVPVLAWPLANLITASSTSKFVVSKDVRVPCTVKSSTVNVPAIDTLFEKVATLTNVAFPVTVITLENDALPVTVITFENVALPVTSK